MKSEDAAAALVRTLYNSEIRLVEGRLETAPDKFKWTDCECAALVELSLRAIYGEYVDFYGL